MLKKLSLLIFLLGGLSIIAACFAETPTAPFIKGIYLSQNTLENTKQLNYLIHRAQETGINTFVIDFNRSSKKYQQNIQLVKTNHLKYVARIVIFPGGANQDQMSSQAYWEKRLAVIKQAVALGADEIQLDYIRYNTAQTPSPQNAKNVERVIKWFKQHAVALGVPLQADVFGITSFREEQRIGQNVAAIGAIVDVLCPMVYPSHYEPYREHATSPYKTVFSSLAALQKQFKDGRNFKLYPFIELSNYRYPLTQAQKLSYILEQIKATEDAKADGWYAWSASNFYDNLFTVLEKQYSTQ